MFHSRFVAVLRRWYSSTKWFWILGTLELIRYFFPRTAYYCGTSLQPLGVQKLDPYAQELCWFELTSAFLSHVWFYFGTNSNGTSGCEAEQQAIGIMCWAEASPYWASNFLQLVMGRREASYNIIAWTKVDQSINLRGGYVWLSGWCLWCEKKAGQYHPVVSVGQAASEHVVNRFELLRWKVL